jgi:hypothetical protein
MPIVAATPTTITRPEELVEYLSEMFKQSELGFEYIAKYDEKLIPKYPALHLQAANFDKTLHSTNNFLIGMRAAIHVLHGDMMQDRQTRNYEDLRLATQVVSFLESDMTLGQHITHGFVESEIPGVLPPRVTKGEAIISTRLNWFGISLRRFK